MNKIFGNIITFMETFNWSDIFFFTSTLVLLILLVYIVYLVRIEEKELINVTDKIDTNKIKKEIKSDLEKKK